MRALIRRLAAFAVGLFYRREVLGAAVPAEGPVVLVGNHPNGLVDPILLAGTTPRPVRFLGKAPLFDMPVLGFLMRGLEALPVHRPQDGADPEDNRATFEAVERALVDGDVICLFPEGRSHSEPSLQRLKTGAARMALGAEAARGFGLGLCIVPVGLTYGSNRRFRSRVAVRIGEPIAAGDLRELHAADERAAVRALTSRIEEGLASVTLNLESWEDLPLLEVAERITRTEGGERIRRLGAFARGLRELRRTEPERIDELALRLAAFRERLERLGLSAGDLDVRYDARRVASFAARTALRLALSLPLALLGIALWLIPYRAVGLLLAWRRPSRDVHATVAILAGSVFFPLAWLAIAAVLWTLAGPWIALAGALAAPWLGVFALEFLEWRRSRRADVGAFLRLGRRSRLRAHLAAQRDALAGEIRGLIEELRVRPGSARNTFPGP